jgi:hypothetical protein
LLNENLALVLILGFYTIRLLKVPDSRKMGFREALNKGIDKEGKKSLKMIS